MNIAQFEQDGMRYTFEPPVEVGNKAVASIHELAAVAVLGSEASSSDIDSSMERFTVTLHEESRNRVSAFNVFLWGLHVVSGESVGPGMPTWSSKTPLRRRAPGAVLSPDSARRLEEELRDIDESRMAVRGNDPIVY